MFATVVMGQIFKASLPNDCFGSDDFIVARMDVKVDPGPASQIYLIVPWADADKSLKQKARSTEMCEGL